MKINMIGGMGGNVGGNVWLMALKTAQPNWLFAAVSPLMNQLKKLS
jgi:hypothetical protein